MSDRSEITPNRYQARLHPRTLMGWLGLLLPLGIFAGLMFTGDDLTDGLIHNRLYNILWLATAAGMAIHWMSRILYPKAGEWLDPVLDAERIAASRRKDRQWSIASLLLATLIAAIALSDLMGWELMP